MASFKALGPRLTCDADGSTNKESALVISAKWIHIVVGLHQSDTYKAKQQGPIKPSSPPGRTLLPSLIVLARPDFPPIICHPATMSDTETDEHTVFELDTPPRVSIDDATNTDVEDRTVGDHTPQTCIHNSSSDTELGTDAASPGGSLKDLYVPSRPTSMDGLVIPGTASTPDEVEPDLFHFGLARAPADVLFPPMNATPLAGFSSTHLDFPTPPTINSVPVGKRRRYAQSMKSLYTGTGVGTILRTNQAPIIRVRAVPRPLEDDDEEVPNVQPPPTSSSRSWPGKALRKIVPGLFRRPAATHGAKGVNARSTSHSTQSLTPTSPAVVSHSPSRMRSLSIRSFKSFTSKGKARAAGIENIPPVPGRAPPRPRLYPFSGYFVDSELLMDEEDETEPEMTAIQLEALVTTLKINERFEYVLVNPEEIGVAL
ncbi:hypothetical protein C8R45DRAFT_1218140 [Mycena sanguinolenta]|nr:hypothetical protein C8R45DRAFT_1218140 [Mycena sanguinolenta]